MKRVVAFVVLVVLGAGTFYYLKKREAEKTPLPAPSEITSVDNTESSRPRSGSGPKPSRSHGSLDLSALRGTVYVNGRLAETQKVDLPPGQIVVNALDQGSFSHHVLDLSENQTVRIEPRFKSAQPVTSWKSFQGGPLRAGFVVGPVNPSLETVWQAQIPGEVTASPVVSDQLVLFTSDQRQLVALDLRSGQVAWEVEGNGTEMTPVLLSEHVIAADRIGGLRAYRLKDGKERGELKMGSYVISMAAQGEDQLIVITGDHSVHGLDLKHRRRDRVSFKPQWTVAVPELEGSNASPAFSDSIVLLQTTQRGLVALSAQDGSLIWSTKPVSGQAQSSDGIPMTMSFTDNERPLVPTPAVADKVVYSAQDGYLEANEVLTGNSVWRKDVKYRPTSSVTVAYEMMFVGDSKGNLNVHSLQNGAMVYSQNISDKPIIAGPLVSGSYVYVATNGGAVTCLNAFTGQEQKRVNHLKAGILATPAGTSSHLIAVSKTGMAICLN